MFDRAIRVAGLEFRSDRLWEMYIAFETERKNFRNVLAIYDRLIATPTQLYSHQFEKFEQFVRAHHPKEILSADELASLQQGLAKEVKDNEGDASSASPPSGLENDDGNSRSAESKSGKVSCHLEARMHSHNSSICGFIFINPRLLF